MIENVVLNDKIFVSAKSIVALIGVYYDIQCVTYTNDAFDTG